MLLTTHALTGAVIGKNLNNPYAIVAISIAVHFILDTFRHGEYLNPKSKWNEFWKVAIDLAIAASLIGLVIIFFSDPTQVKNILLGSFFAMLPDFLTLLYWKLNFKFLKFYYDFHGWLHRHEQFSKETEFTLRNAANDIIVSILMIAILIA